MCMDKLSERIFVPDGGYWFIILSFKYFCNMHDFENWGILFGYSPVLAGEYSVK